MEACRLPGSGIKLLVLFCWFAGEVPKLGSARSGTKYHQHGWLAFQGTRFGLGLTRNQKKPRLWEEKNDEPPMILNDPKAPLMEAPQDGSPCEDRLN